MTIHDLVEYSKARQDAALLVNVMLDDNLGYGIDTVELDGFIMAQDEYIALRPSLIQAQRAVQPAQVLNFFRPIAPINMMQLWNIIAI